MTLLGPLVDVRWTPVVGTVLPDATVSATPTARTTWPSQLVCLRTRSYNIPKVRSQGERKHDKKRGKILSSLRSSARSRPASGARPDYTECHCRSTRGNSTVLDNTRRSLFSRTMFSWCLTQTESFRKVTSLERLLKVSEIVSFWCLLHVQKRVLAPKHFTSKPVVVRN